jgi:hypothetical protein
MLANSTSDQAILPATCNLARPNPEKRQGFIGGTFSRMRPVSKQRSGPNLWRDSQRLRTCVLKLNSGSDEKKGMAVEE